MKEKLKAVSMFILTALLVSCAGMQRQCSSGCASSLGADWIVVQYKLDGSPLNCWTLEGVSMAAEEGGGVQWQSEDGHLVHIGGHYNRVQVEHQAWDSAAKTVGIDRNRCNDGAYK